MKMAKPRRNAPTGKSPSVDLSVKRTDNKNVPKKVSQSVGRKIRRANVQDVDNCRDIVQLLVLIHEMR